MNVGDLYFSVQESLTKIATLHRREACQADPEDTPALLASAEASLARVAASSRESWSDTKPSAQSIPGTGDPVSVLQFCGDEYSPSHPHARAKQKSFLSRLPSGGVRLIAVSALATGLLLIVWHSLSAPPQTVPGAQPRVVATVAAASPAGAAALPAAPVPLSMPAPALPRLDVLVGIDSGTDSRIAADLLRGVARAGGLDVRLVPRNGWAESLPRSQSGPQLALMRYDALQAARRLQPQQGADGLRVVTPLYTEELHVIARRDSPLRYVHQIEGARINVGPAGGPRALTASTLYERMFGQPMRADTAYGRLDEEAALAALLQDKSIDVMVVVGAQPATWLADLDPAKKSALKLLQVDRGHPASRAALRSFLPGTLRPASYPGWLAAETPTLALMSFLVTGSGAADDPQLGMLAHSLCRNLPDLQREGHPKWREVQPGLQLDVGWPYSSAAKQAFRNCPTQLSSATGAKP